MTNIFPEVSKIVLANIRDFVEKNFPNLTDLEREQVFVRLLNAWRISNFGAEASNTTVHEIA